MAPFSSLAYLLRVYILLWLQLLCSLWQAFSIVPAECIVGRRLGFYYELVATLLLPVLSFGVVMLVALQP